MIDSNPPSGKAQIYRRPGRPGAVSQAEVDRVCDELFFAKESITVDRVLDRTGGSKTTVSPMVDGWRRRLADRVRRGPQAFERLPASIVHIVEALYDRCRQEAEIALQSEHASKADQLSRARNAAEIQSHVARLREKEWADALADREQQIVALRMQLQEYSTLVAKLEGSKKSLEKQIQIARSELAIERTQWLAVKRTPARRKNASTTGPRNVKARRKRSVRK